MPRARHELRSRGEATLHTKPWSHRGGRRRRHRHNHRPARAPWWLAAAAAALTLPAQAASLYLCKTHGGATFWSAAHGRQHDALIDRIESVPDGLPFDQQVALARQPPIGEQQDRICSRKQKAQDRQFQLRC